MLRVAVAGLGRIGRLHAEILRYHVKGARLVAVVDVIESLAKSTAGELGVDWYTSYDRVLDLVDAVWVCTPTFLHRDMIVRAAEKGVHVFTEKPLTVTSEEARDVLRAVEKAGVRLMVGYMRRFDYVFKKAYEDIRAGRVGRPLTYVTLVRDPGPPPGWAADPGKSGGIFLDMLSHDFDMARWLMGDEVTEVHVYAGTYMFPELGEKGDVDVATLNFRFSKGALGVIHAARKNPYGYDLRVEVYGDKGVIYAGANIDHNYSLGTEEGVRYLGQQWFWKRFYEAYRDEDQAFVKSVEEDRQPPITGEDGYRLVRIAEAAWESLRKGGPVKVTY